MDKNDSANDFLASALNYKGEYISTPEFMNWVDKRREAVEVHVEEIPFSKLQKWHFEKTTGNLVHDSGKFFSIVGADIRTNWGNVNHWTQPIINQPEIGFLGILTRKINGVLHFLMQSKIEPGNINFVQISPTLQATKSNYTKVHQGNSPAYIEYFLDRTKSRVLMDQLQSEQGARFLKKRNRNIILEVSENVPVGEDFCWLTLGQLKELLQIDNLVNMDSRTVLSGINFGTLSNSGAIEEGKNYFKNAFVNSEMLRSCIDANKAYHSFEEIISWVTNLKSKYELEVTKIPFNTVEKWLTEEMQIRHETGRYFSVIAANVSIANREVVSWSQPLVKSAQEGLIAFIIKSIGGVIHFLVQAKIEAGNFDILELAPSVQCLTGNYRKGSNEYEVPFIDTVLEAPPANIIYKAMQSEEGGRFFREQNLNMIVRVDDRFSNEVPENFCWMTLYQLQTFMRFNNYLNIQARSLLSVLKF